MKKLIMTDFDCTLLPMDQDLYLKRYFIEVVKLYTEHGYDGQAIAKATMKACDAMIKNDGTKTNAQAFNEAFSMFVNNDADKIIEIFEQLYGDRYNSLKDVSTYNDKAQAIVELMREKSQYAVVATAPLFPLEAVIKRLSWTGLKLEQFDYVTTYDSCHYSKPNPMYYQEIMDKFDVKPLDTLMIGNDVTEDILPCLELGVDTFLVTDNLINTIDHDISKLRNGTTDELIEYLNAL